ncbi:coiled-coil domain-containing protein 113 isoform X1 [Latimeria chalumnae]|uniref:Cilia- and flagella-associated protein 263 n=1 Tax=Latimeria chalumnae TaxID=7897 RepID=H2ZZC9_LATCH|nr:PREDICTED: coiled-coil domain-containing protein 113 isoform X1 [Latimeria chalumnae]|eukprot:XP_006013002.1 PREDICTED: coiled-coil domain-containing protein 113 isoform X1 [Latimeria chalumnae]
MADTGLERFPDLSRLKDLTEEQLQLLVDDISRSNGVLQSEVKIFENYIRRVEPKDWALQPTAEILAQDSALPLRGRKRSKARVSSSACVMRLTVEQKCDIAQRELEEIKDELDCLKESSERVLDNHKAAIEEAEIRQGEVKKAWYEFERDIGKTIVEKLGGFFTAEKIYRYMQDKIRAKETLTDKLRLKNAALKVQKKKVRMQLRQKEETEEVLHEVDFQQLKIENRQFLEKIDERNRDLLRLKLMAGNTMQVLNSYKKKLQSMTEESMHLTRDISSKQQMIQDIEEETKVVEEERAKAEALNIKLRTQLSDYRVPHVLEYVYKKATHSEMEKCIKSWQRKVEVAEMTLKKHRKAWNQLKVASGQMQGWAPAHGIHWKE